MQSARINQWGTFALKRGKVNLKYVIVNKRLANRLAIQARATTGSNFVYSFSFTITIVFVIFLGQR